jgi:hypothetical protein
MNDYTLQSQKGIAKSFDNGSKIDLSRFIKLPIFNVQGDDEWASLFTSTEGFSGMRESGEHETPEVNSLGDGYSITISKKRFTNAYEITSTDIEARKDSTTKVDQFLIRQRDHALANASRFFTKGLLDFLNYGDVTTKYAAPDTKALYADDHAWASGETFDNKGTSTFSQSAVQAALLAGSLIEDGSGELMDVNYDTIVVYKNTETAVEAKKLFANGINATAVGDVNIYNGTMTIIELPLYVVANAADWFLFDTSMPDENPLYAGIGQFPHFTAPKVQNNEAIRQNIEGFWKQGIVNMPYMTYGQFPA